MSRLPNNQVVRYRRHEPEPAEPALQTARTPSDPVDPDLPGRLRAPVPDPAIWRQWFIVALVCFPVGVVLSVRAQAALGVAGGILLTAGVVALIGGLLTWLCGGEDV